MVEAGFITRSAPKATVGRGAPISCTYTATLASGSFVRASACLTVSGNPAGCASACGAGQMTANTRRRAVSRMVVRAVNISSLKVYARTSCLFEDFERATREEPDLFVVDHVGRHEVDSVADRTQQQFALQRLREKPACKIRMLRFHLERPDHAGVAEIAGFRMLRDLVRSRSERCASITVCGNDVVVLENVERCERRTAGECVAGIGVRVQETTR